MATSSDTAAYPPVVLEEFARLAEACRLCYQCGQCTSSCPSARDLYRGPRRLVRLILAGEIEAVLKSDDLWRCTECGACTAGCRMDIDVADVLRRLRALEREYGRLIRCPERSAAQLSTRRLRRRPRIDNVRLGLAMAAEGHLPKDLRGAAEVGLNTVRGRLQTRKAPPAHVATDTVLAFYSGCALTQDHRLHALVHDVAGGFGVRLDEAADASCCGHPSRGAVGSLYTGAESVCTTCPACDTALRDAGVKALPLWDALTEHTARRPELALRAAAPAFVPYVGCLADRDRALAALSSAARQSGSGLRVAYPSLHSGCCGALGGMYRGATKASGRLLAFARESQAPIVTTCLLCRDNTRSAARELRIDVTVHFWPEFFRAGRHVPQEPPDG